MFHWKHREGKRGEAGYGVMELAVVVSAGVVVTTIAVMGFSKAKARYQLRHKAQRITQQIERARSLAIRQNKTLTLGFMSRNKVFGLTCEDCDEVRSELKSLEIPGDVSLSEFPTLTIKGNGTIQASKASFTITDQDGRQVPVMISNSGRVAVGEVGDAVLVDTQTK
jgi:hypothetical protein